MFRWVPYAMVRIALFFVAGILLAIYFPNFVYVSASKILALVLLASYLLLYWLSTNKKFSSLIGFIGLLAVLVAGYLHLTIFTNWGKQDHLSTFKKEIKFYVATIKEYPEEKDKSWKYKVELNQLNDGKTGHKIDGSVLLYVRKDGSKPKYFYGDKILVKGSPELISPPQNPHEFDFKRFLSFKNIYHQQFVRPEQLRYINSITEKDIKYYSYRAREWAVAKLTRQLPNQQERAIALALTLGVKDGIDNDLQNAYASSGAMHVLAVSGLHVGILYGIVLLFFRPFMGLAYSRWIVAIVSLFVLWSFAFITGLSPSVMRAVAMFSFMAIAKPFGRRTSIYNTLACSAFLLLLVDPYLIMSVGFQLSYLAVLGIVTIHRPLYQLLEPSSAVIDWIWNISCVSIAAQLATFSLGILYFHQFPVYFLFSNLFIIPGAILVLVTSILVIASSFFAPLANLIGSLLEGIIHLLNYVVFTFEKFPYSLINEIYINTLQCWLLLLAIGFILLFLYFRRLSALLTAFVFISCFSVSQWYHYENGVRGNQLVVYNISGHHGLEWISNGRSKFFADSALVSDSERMRFHILPNRLFHGVKYVEIEQFDLEEEVNLIHIEGKLMGILLRPIKSWPKDLKLDYLVVANNSVRSFSDITKLIPFDKLILDGSNSHYLADRIRDEGGEMVYSVLHEGAFVKDF